MQRVAINGESKSLCKPPKVMGRVSPVITPATKRGSLGANHVKVEKDNAKSSTGDLDSTKKLTGKIQISFRYIYVFSMCTNMLKC